MTKTNSKLDTSIPGLELSQLSIHVHRPLLLNFSDENIKQIKQASYLCKLGKQLCVDLMVRGHRQTIDLLNRGTAGCKNGLM